MRLENTYYEVFYLLEKMILNVHTLYLLTENGCKNGIWLTLFDK